MSDDSNRTASRTNTVAPEQTTDTNAPGAPTVPGYVLLGELGRGGMGVVYRARQRGLNRDVALKTVLRADAAGAKVARFWAEAEAMAAVKHPHVLQVFELGESGGVPFLAMEYVTGGSLADLLRTDGRMPVRAAVELVEKVASGVAAAHDQGIVHRDIKPANMLLDADGEPKVSDFGLAKWRSTDLTRTQAVMGTPAYMSPEQAKGETKFVGPQADVWALGVVLYECLAGRPFEAKSTDVLLAQIQSAEPIALRSRVRAMPRDLETIVAKCLAKEPERRYPTAGALADDLGRFLAGEPIAARPVGRAERLVRWARRKPTAAATYGLSALAVLLAAVVFVVFGFWREAEEARGTAEVAKKDADTARGRVQGLLDTESKLRGELQVANGKLQVAFAGEAKAKDEARYLNYASSVGLAYQECLAGRPASAEQLLEGCERELRNWEWSYVRRLCDNELAVFKGHTASVLSAVFSADGRLVVTGSQDGTARVWDARTGKELAVCVGHTSMVRASISPDGRRVLTSSNDGTARVWDAATGKELAVMRGHAAFVRSAEFSADGQRVVTGSADNTARIWDAASGKELVAFKGHTAQVMFASFAPGERVVTRATDGTIRVWDAATSKPLTVITAGKELILKHQTSADGRRVLGAVGSGARLWSAETGEEIVALRGHTGVVFAAEWSSDEKRIVTASGDNTARIWDAATGNELVALKGHTLLVGAATFSPDGKRVITTSLDQTVRVWDAVTGKQLAVFGHAKFVGSAAYSADGRRIVTAAGEVARAWEPEPEQPLMFEGAETRVGAATVAGDGRRAVGRTFQKKNVALVWDADQPKKVVELVGHEDSVNWAWLSPDGRHVVTASHDQTARVWDAATGKVLVVFRGHTGRVASATFSADGRRVVSAGYDRTFRVWDAATGKELAVFRGYPGGERG